MKYQLISKQTGEQTLCDKVTIDGFDYYVSDEEIKSWDFVGFPSLLHWTPIQYVGGDLTGYEKKIIATNNQSLDIPKVVDEVYIMSKSLYPSSPQKAKHFIAGHTKSQKTHPFSEEDADAYADAVMGGCLLRAKEWREQRPKKVYYEK